MRQARDVLYTIITILILFAVYVVLFGRGAVVTELSDVSAPSSKVDQSSARP